MINQKCKYCEPWYNPKPIINTSRIFVRVRVMDDMYCYLEVWYKGIFKWRCIELNPINKCPICGKEV